MTTLLERERQESAGSNLRPEVEVMNTLRQGARWSVTARLVFLVCLIGGGLGIYGGVKRYYKPEPPQYRTQQCRRGGLVVTVTATGTLDPTKLVEIGCEISGTIRTVEVDVNDPVRAGDLLLTLDTQELEAQVAKSRASLDAKQAELKHAEATLLESEQNFRRAGMLLSRGAGSEEQYVAAKANLGRAKANVASSKAQISVAKATLDGDLFKLKKSRIYSPIDGIVLSRNVEPGQTIAATFQTPVLLTICDDLRKMKLKVDVDEADVGGVREGQQATFTVDAYPNETFPARITSLRYASRRVQDVVTYEAILEVANPQLKLRPGMTATADIITAKNQDALIVPNAALRFTSNGDSPGTPLDGDKSSKSHVWILEKNRPIPIPVTIGHTDGRHTEIKSGAVQEGTHLVVSVIP